MGENALNNLSPELLAQLFSQSSDDPFLTLVTLSHEDFASDIRLVNNTVDIVSNSLTYQAFPMRVRFPVDDGESARDFQLEFDNVSLDLIDEIRSVTTKIGVKIELILASMPDVIQMSQPDLQIVNVSYNAQRITAKVVLDDFLTVSMTSERYNPTNFPGIFS